MSLRSIYGHDPLLHRLEGAIASGRFPQAALLVGPPGVGKQRLALWIATALLCDTHGGAGCGECESCRMAGRLAHPDLHWFVPILRPKASDRVKQVEETQTLIGEAVAERRNKPLYGPPDALASHPLASIRLLHRVVGLTPFRGSRKVVILGDAERLVVQEASQEAANALLKVLEEPPNNTTLILTVVKSAGLLPTVRSRLVPIRVPRVPDDAVRAFLRHEPNPPLDSDTVERRVALAQGSIGRAIWPAGDEQAAARNAEALLSAIRAGPARWSATALAQPPWAARGGFAAMLDELVIVLRREIADWAERGGDGDGGGGGGDTGRLRRRLDAVQRVEQARASAGGNVNPQLTLAALAHELEALV